VCRLKDENFDEFLEDTKLKTNVKKEYVAIYKNEKIKYKVI